jgi:Cu(I)/Ag(I) efflux system protein CusF
MKLLQEANRAEQQRSRKCTAGLLALLALLSSTPAVAQTGTAGAPRQADPKATAAATPLSDGEVRKVDKSAGKVTIKHGPLSNLGMPPMTMVFRMKNPAMLDQVKEGDKIKFTADQVNGVLTVTQVEVVR